MTVIHPDRAARTVAIRRCFSLGTSKVPVFSTVAPFLWTNYIVPHILSDTSRHASYCIGSRPGIIDGRRLFRLLFKNLQTETELRSFIDQAVVQSRMFS
jgi:hypothetical protein